MRLPGTIDERLDILLAERRRLLRETDVATLEDAGIRVDCSLTGTTGCIQLRLIPQDVQFLREAMCADFALLLPHSDGVFEAHVVELKRSVGEKDWSHIQQQLEWAVVRLLAIVGVLGVQLHGVAVYTAFCVDRLSREGSPNPAAMKIPVAPSAGANDAMALRWAEARRSWERGRLRLEVFGEDVEHRRIRTNEAGCAAVACHRRPSPGERDTRWFFEPVAG